MTKEFHQLLDWVIVKIDSKIYADTPENFVKDFGVVFSPLPIGITQRHYVQGQYHALKAGANVVDGGERDCKITNKYFDNLDNALGNKINREEQEEEIRHQNFKRKEQIAIDEQDAKNAVTLEEKHKELEKQKKIYEDKILDEKTLKAEVEKTQKDSENALMDKIAVRVLEELMKKK